MTGERITTAEAARRLRRSPNTLRSYLRRGIPAYVAAAILPVPGTRGIRWDAAAIDRIGRQETQP